MIQAAVAQTVARVSAGACLPWYGLRTRSNFERTTTAYLASRGLEPYLPLHRVARRWSDRTVQTALPLFPGYLFCRFDAKDRVPVLSAPGLVSILGFGSDPVVISEEEIEAVQRLVDSGLALETENSTRLREGEDVIVVSGALEGLRGKLIEIKSRSRFVVSVEMLQRSVSVEIDRTWVKSTD